MADISARDAALRLLSYRDRTRRELTERLQRKGYPVEEVELAVLRMQELGFLDDQKFALSYASRRRDSGYGPRCIKWELQNKGVEEEVIEQALASTFPPGKEAQAATAYLESCLSRAGTGECKEKQFRRLGSRMLRRGFSPRVVMQVLKNDCDPWE